MNIEENRFFQFRFGNERKQRQDASRYFKKSGCKKKGPALKALW
jgi:hypothetical protein